MIHYVMRSTFGCVSNMLQKRNSDRVGVIVSFREVVICTATIRYNTDRKSMPSYQR